MKSIVGKVAHLLRSVDLMGGTVSLSIKNGSATFKTLFGALLTAACFGAIIWYTVQIARSIFDRNHPLVLCTKESDLENVQYKLKYTNLMPSFILYNKKTLQPESLDLLSKFSTLKADYWRSYYDFEKFVSVEQIVSLDMKPCLSLINKRPYQWIFDNSNYTMNAINFVCFEIPENMDLTVRGGRASSEITAFRVFAYPCSLPDQSKCEAYSRYSGYSLISFNVRKYITFSDFNQPVKIAVNTREEINLQKSLGKKYFQFLKKFVIHDETNYLQPKTEDKEEEDIEREEVNLYERDGKTACSLSQIEGGLCDPYLSIEFRSSGLQDTCVRTYTNIIDAVSNIGGFKELVFMGVVVVYTFYNDF